LVDVKDPWIPPILNIKTEDMKHDSGKVTTAEDDDDQGKDLICLDDIPL
jgi:hypothetical protein